MKIRNEDQNWNGLHLRVTVEDDDWFCYGAIIRSGVAIGEGSSAASGQVVIKNVFPYMIVGRNSAK